MVTELELAGNPILPRTGERILPSQGYSRMPARNEVKIVLPCHLEGEWLRYTVDSILEHTTYPSFSILVLANGDSVTDFSFIGEPAYRHRVRLSSFRDALGVGNCLNEAVWPGDADWRRYLDWFPDRRLADIDQPSVGDRRDLGDRHSGSEV